MNRRTFTFSLAALAASPAISVAGPAAPSATAASKLAHARIIARAHNACSPAMLQRLLRVDATVAAELNTILVQRGVITAAGSNGVAMAINPTNTNCIPTQALKQTNFSKPADSLRDKIKEMIHDVVENDDVRDETHDITITAPRQETE